MLSARYGVYWLRTCTASRSRACDCDCAACAQAVPQVQASRLSKGSARSVRWRGNTGIGQNS